MLAQFAEAGIDVEELAAKLQRDGARTFEDSWTELMGSITSQATAG